MATPNLSQHSKAAPTPRPLTSASVMTPASFSASSPAAPASGGHRSYPSPAAAFSSTPSSTSKSQMNTKSPLNNLQQMQMLAAGGQAMSRSGTNTSSPGLGGGLGAFAGLNAMLMMNAGEGIKTGLTPVGGLGTPLGGSPLPSHVGDGGLTSVNGSLKQQNRDQEEERRLRLQHITSLLAQRWGYVSTEGVERCARRVGLECLWDEIPGADGRTLSIAGNSVLVEVQFMKKGNEIGSVTLAFPEREDGEWGKSAAAGAEVLKNNLEGGQTHDMGFVILDSFVENLEKLAHLDRLSAASVNCFDAIDGVGNALRKVWESDIRRKRAEKRASLEEADQIVLCQQNGRPTMHSGSQLGLALQYWKDGRHLARRKRKADEMDIDGSSDFDEQEVDQPTTWSLAIGCESSLADTYPAIRISNEWVSFPASLNDEAKGEQLNSSAAGDSIEWQEPPPAFLSTDPSAPSLEAAKQPDIRFVAHLNPPVLVPLQTALNVYNSVGSPLPESSMQQPTTYTQLLLPTHNLATTSSEITAEREMLLPPTVDGIETKKHKFTLLSSSSQEIFAANIEHIPFSHPRQLIVLLPVLRQWALVSSLLRRCFNDPPPEEEKPATNGERDSDSDSDSDGEEKSVRDKLDALLNGAATESGNLTRVDINVSLSAPSPTISLVFPYQSTLAGLSFEVGLNGEIQGVELKLGTATNPDDVVAGEGDGRKSKKTERREEKVRKVLEISEDLSAVVEWMSR
ncbi:MAG: hypothetical protein Q9202_004531 [Teloschistes flavicans]